MHIQYFKKWWKFSIARSGSVFRFDAFGCLVFLKLGSAYFLFCKRIWKSY